MILPLQKSTNKKNDHEFIYNHYSFLNGLVPQYNKIVQKHLVSYLKTVADGRTVIDMKQVIGKVTLEIISEVKIYNSVIITNGISLKRNRLKCNTQQFC